MVHPEDTTRKDETRPKMRQRIEEFLGIEEGGEASAIDHEGVAEHLERRFWPETRAEPETPASYGPFRVERPLGRGGMGSVYLAVHTKTGAKAAIKTAPKSRPKDVEGLCAETRALAAIASAHTIRILDAGETEDVVWLALEYIEGRNLKQIIAEELASWHPKSGEDEPGKDLIAHPDRVRRIVGWFRDLARALAALHAVDFVHRDVKPPNVMISDEGVAYLIDFGLSFSPFESIEIGLAGTVPYMSPEQTLGGQLQLRPSSDLYALAVTFYEALVLRPVVTGRKAEVLKQIAFEDVPPLSRAGPGLPESLDPIFAYALAKNPDSRYASAAFLAEDLERWLAGKGPLHAPLASSRKLKSFVARAWWWIVPLLLLILGLGWYLRHESALREVLSGIDTRLDREPPDDALRFALSHLDSWRDNARFRDRVARAVAYVAPLRTDHLLKSQAFTIPGAKAPLRAVYARDAEQLLPLVEDKDLVLQRAFHALNEKSGLDAARAILAAHPEVVARSAALTELELLVLKQQTEPDPEAIRSVLARLAGLAQLGSDTALCMRALRILWRGASGKGPTVDDLRSLRGDLEKSLNLRSHELLRALHIQTLMALRLDEEADREVRRLLLRELPTDARAALLIRAQVTGIFKLIEPQTSEIDELIKLYGQAVNAARTAGVKSGEGGSFVAAKELVFRHVASALIRELGEPPPAGTSRSLMRSWKAMSQWFTAWQNIEPADPAVTSFSAVSLAEQLAAAALVGKDWTACYQLARDAERLALGVTDARAEGCVLRAQQNAIWAGVYSLQGKMEVKDLEAAKDLLSSTREWLQKMPEDLAQSDPSLLGAKFILDLRAMRLGLARNGELDIIVGARAHLTLLEKHENLGPRRVAEVLKAALDDLQ